MKKYDTYKPSGVEWLGDIPEHWEVSKLGNALSPISINNRTDLPLLSITREKGVILRNIDDEEENHNFIPDDLSNYKLLEKGQFGMNKMKAWQGSYGISNYDGIVSPAYFIFKLNQNIHPNYFHTSIRSKLYISFFGSASDGVRIGQWDLSKERMKQIPFLVPPLSEQEKIAQFLDDKTTKIDKAISIKQQQIELLKERRQILIHQAVTKGVKTLHATSLRDSGVEWIGEIPEGWEVKRLKDICHINLISLPENTNNNFEFEYVDIGSVTLEDGIQRTELFTFKNAPSRARRIAKKGDTIISTVRTYLKAIDFITEEKSNYIYSTGFAILQPKKLIYPEYLGNFVRSDAFTEQVTVNSKGMSYPAINSTDISRLFIVQPPIQEQLDISNHIETATTKIATAISLKEQEIEKLKEYKSSLINDVVTGKNEGGMISVVETLHATSLRQTHLSLRNAFIIAKRIYHCETYLSLRNAFIIAKRIYHCETHLSLRNAFIIAKRIYHCETHLSLRNAIIIAKRIYHCETYLSLRNVFIIAKRIYHCETYLSFEKRIHHLKTKIKNEIVIIQRRCIF